MAAKKENAVRKNTRDTAPAKEFSEEEHGREVAVAEENAGGARMFSAAFALLCCGASLYTRQTPAAIFCFGVFLVLRLNELPPFLEKHGEKIFMAVSALIVATGIVVRAVMYVKCRSLWLDEALLAENIAARSWGELLASPLSNGQSAPVLYVVVEKAFGSVLGYSEFSLRVFSFLSFIGLLVCEWFLLRNVLRVDGIKTAFALAITAFVPSFVYYSNELKPYMGDAFFVVLALLLYAIYAQNKVSLVKLTVFYVLILGFCSPAVFFIGGILASEFLSAVFAKDKKRALHAVISGVSVVAIFCMYYYWWMRPITDAMDNFWNKSPDKSGFNAFFIVLVISLYFLYALHARNKAALIILTLFYMLILWFCPPAVFFVGGALTGEFFAAAFARNKKRVILILASILSIGAAFGLCYLSRTSSVSEALKDFWNNPSGKTGLINGIKGIFTVFDMESKLVWALVPFALLGIYSLIKQKNNVAYSVVLSMFFACLASSIGKWPLSGRLWLFLPAMVVIFSAVGYDLISKGDNAVIRRVVFCLFSAITVFYAADSFSMFKDGVYRVTEETNPLIQYVKEHIESDEKLYVYPGAGPTLNFKTGYTIGRIGKTDVDNIIYGINRAEWNEYKLGAELDTIIKSRRAYLLFQHFWYGIEPGLAVLNEYGTLGMVLNNHDTPLFYFEADEQIREEDAPRP